MLYLTIAFREIKGGVLMKKEHEELPAPILSFAETLAVTCIVDVLQA